MKCEIGKVLELSIRTEVTKVDDLDDVSEEF